MNRPAITALLVVAVCNITAIPVYTDMELITGVLWVINIMAGSFLYGLLDN